MQRLSTFIRQNEEEILTEWESFARTLPGGTSMDVTALRDHAKEMLRTVATDLASPQTSQYQSDKSQGKTDAPDRGMTPAQKHGSDRAEGGFTIVAMVSEFRALRASVLRLWSRKEGEASSTDLEDMTRFNEAIDQAIAESVARFNDDVEASKERFLAILGHDLGTPLGAVVTAGQFLIETAQLPDPQREMVKRINSSATRMQHMVNDMLDFTRTRLGDTIPISAARINLGDVMQAAVDEISASYPQSDVRLDCSGNLEGTWDRERLMQVATNLMGNAIHHGKAETPIIVKVRGETSDVHFSVTNQGPVLTESNVKQLFVPPNLRDGGIQRERRHLGLGLYIVDRIVRAHGGSITVTSTQAAGTTFLVRLPRA